MFKAFLAHRPKQMNKPEEAFYLQCINKQLQAHFGIWYKCQRMHRNSHGLGNLIKTTLAAAGLEGKRYVNYPAVRLSLKHSSMQESTVLKPHSLTPALTKIEEFPVTLFFIRTSNFWAEAECS